MVHLDEMWHLLKLQLISIVAFTFVLHGHLNATLQNMYICLGEQSFKHANVLSEKNNFSAPGGQKVAIFGMEDLDPQYFDVSNFSVPPDPPYMSKNANMCYF